MAYEIGIYNPDAARADLNPNAFRDQRAFIVNWGDYYVIDGDTIAILSGDRRYSAQHDRNMRTTAFRIRHYTIDAPELPAFHTQPKQENREFHPYYDHPGVQSAGRLREICHGRALFVEQRGIDRYGRMLADVTVSGEQFRKGFVPDDAASTEHLMVMSRDALWRDNVPRPPYTPEVIVEYLREREAHEAVDASRAQSSPDADMSP